MSFNLLGGAVFVRDVEAQPGNGRLGEATLPLRVKAVGSVPCGHTLQICAEADNDGGQDQSSDTRGDQAVRSGQILVSVEDHSPQAHSRLADAARIVAEAGARPVALPEG